MPKKYFVFLPSVSGSVEEELNQCLNQIIKTRDAGYRPVKLNIFTDMPGFETFISVRQKILSNIITAFGNTCPAVNITVQPPEKPWKTTIEALFVVEDSPGITSKLHNSIPYIVLESETGKELWSCGVSSYSDPADTGRAAEKAFDLMVNILDKEQMSMNNVVRQWNYIGDILKVDMGYQNYQIFNEVRSEYYQRYRSKTDFPAATGVGMKHGGVILDFCAMQPNKQVFIKPVENPNQFNAYSYGQQVLMGVPDRGKTGMHPPQFERGLLIANEHHSTLYISGTASIVGQETIGTGDIEKQTLVTIENIRKLSDPGRISNMISRPVPYKGFFSMLRVYIKRPGDFSLVRQICNKHFPGIPAVFIEADICRTDLLIEIEGEVILK
jgi:enamine deaminase RidA (YjgF/YER057c/UK114 family)